MNNPQRSDETRGPSLPEIKFWQNREKELVNPDLFSDVADKWAANIKESGTREGDKNKISQIRKFYDEVLLFASRVRGEEDFQKMLPYIKMLNAKAAYAKGRKHITEDFKNFISNCLSQIQTKKDFDVFTKFFESFMGYYKYYEETKSRR